MYIIIRRNLLSVKIVVEIIWPVETGIRKWSLKISLVWEVLFEDIEFELGEKEEVAKTKVYSK